MSYSEVMTQLGVHPTMESELGTSLLGSLPNARGENVAIHFGDAFEGQENDDYSDSHVFYTSGHLCTLYMSCGTWRFGTTEKGRADYRLLRKLVHLRQILEA